MPHFPETNDDGEIVSAVDWLGNRFHVGDTVIYCIGAGRGQLMAVGTVQQIVSRPVRSWTATAREEIRVQVKTAKTSGTWDNMARTKPAWVNPQNVTALPVVVTT